MAQQDQFHPGSGHGYVHPAQVVEKSDVSFLIGADHTDDDDVAFLALKTVYRVDGDRLTERLEIRILF